jgi:polyribonucleotide nucleotidyltransferase
VEEAKRRIQLILDPPKAEIGAVYTGKVVNITKFGAFVNILPGRDGLVHISKLGRGKRVERVEDVVDLGDEVEVRVDDIDPQGKVSLSLVGPEGAEPTGQDPGSRSDEGRARPERPERPERPAEGRSSEVSFEAAWEEEARAEFGDLGPAEPASAGGGDGGGRGPRRNPRRGRR